MKFPISAAILAVAAFAAASPVQVDLGLARLPIVRGVANHVVPPVIVSPKKRELPAVGDSINVGQIINTVLQVFGVNPNTKVNIDPTVIQTLVNNINVGNVGNVAKRDLLGGLLGGNGALLGDLLGGNGALLGGLLGGNGDLLGNLLGCLGLDNILGSLLDDAGLGGLLNQVLSLVNQVLGGILGGSSNNPLGGVISGLLTDLPVLGGGNGHTDVVATLLTTVTGLVGGLTSHLPINLDVGAILTNLPIAGPILVEVLGDFHLDVSAFVKLILTITQPTDPNVGLIGDILGKVKLLLEAKVKVTLSDKVTADGKGIVPKLLGNLNANIPVAATASAQLD
ncbi:hypothetical protein EV182_000270 [Spiromyces aspiralis]|uniref:Uncharacterized protein n=1 Tax=Spiromyces aspiralis TaxID=68401 RepID=A0ACC1HH79_9FUNG|nr:hypothetical protein EV182_000270 [Spiromyces aspiralis]